MGQYVEVVTNLPIDSTFQYIVPANASFKAAVGKRVHMPFRTGKRIGYIVKLEDSPVVESPRYLIDIIDEEPIFTEEMIALAFWVKDNYFCSWGEAIEAMIPGALKRGKISMTSRITEEQEEVVRTQALFPNEEQQAVIDQVNECIDKGEHKVFLLHGITGSGKTEIYLQAMENVLKKGRTGIILVPEISLTPQTVERFKSRFGDTVAVFHSKMLQSAKFLEWKRIQQGKAKVVVGPRSAVFSPFKDLGLIVVDEEHEPSYKQEDVPRYHAREVAITRARRAGVPVILGSATPSLESYFRSIKGEFNLVELTQRIEEKKLPRVKIVDMRMELETRSGRKVISKVMEELLKNDISKKQQALIFLNRRGFSTFVICRNCGYVLKCLKCDSPLVLHSGRKELVCHYCNKTVKPVEICPKCNSGYMMYRGSGTEKVEEELKKIIPEAVIVRVDSDTMSKRGRLEKVLKKFKEHKIDVIVGTQMIAKGLDFPKVTLVGVVSADANLNLPDFRSGERTFNLITQVAGRAGRGDLGGEVIVQTFTPENYAVNLAAKHDFHGFYLKEIESRHQLMFPPFTSLIKITLRSMNEDMVIQSAERLAKKIIQKMPGYDILGPAPSPMAKLRGFYRWNILVKSKERAQMVRDLKTTIKGFRKGNGVFMAVDVDPMSM